MVDNKKSNYRTVSIHSNISNVYDVCLYDQIYNFFENKSLTFQCGFLKGFNTQIALLLMKEEMLLVCDKKEICETILTYLSKTFDCISHDLLKAKLNAYGFDQKVIHNYLFRRSWKAKVGWFFF